VHPPGLGWIVTDDDQAQTQRPLDLRFVVNAAAACGTVTKALARQAAVECRPMAE